MILRCLIVFQGSGFVLDFIAVLLLASEAIVKGAAHHNHAIAQL